VSRSRTVSASGLAGTFRGPPAVPAVAGFMRRTLRRSPRRVGYCRRMLDASTRSGGTATASPRAVGTPDLALAVPLPAAPAPHAPGPAARWARALLSPWSRLSLLVVLLLSAASVMVLFEPQRLLTDGFPSRLGGAAAVVLYAVAYGVCTVAFVPRPLLNLGAGALFGSQLGLGAALAGTVLGAGLAFCLGRALGQDALRPL